MHPRHIFSMPEHSLIYIKRFEGELSSKVANVYLEFRRCKAKSEGLSFKLFLCCALVVLRAEIRDVFRLLLLFCSIWCHPSVRISSWKTEIRLESLEIALFQAFSHFRLCRPMSKLHNFKLQSRFCIITLLLVAGLSYQLSKCVVKCENFPGIFSCLGRELYTERTPIKTRVYHDGNKTFLGPFPLAPHTHPRAKAHISKKKAPKPSKLIWQLKLRALWLSLLEFNSLPWIISAIIDSDFVALSSAYISARTNFSPHGRHFAVSPSPSLFPSANILSENVVKQILWSVRFSFYSPSFLSSEWRNEASEHLWFFLDRVPFLLFIELN